VDCSSFSAVHAIGEPSVRAANLGRIKQIIHARLGEPDLTLEAIAGGRSLFELCP